MAEEISDNRAGIKTALVFLMLFALLGAVLVFAYFSTFNRPVTTVILVRHAEKRTEPGNSDPDLSPGGQARAEELARMFSEAGIAAIYATQYKRTQQTVKPLADRLGVPITQVDAKNPAELVMRIRSHSGQVVLVSGHNDSVPAIISALGGPSYPTIPDNEFDNLYIVTVYRVGKAKAVKIKYGNPSQ